MTADADGRLQVVVDLGPSHSSTEFTPRSDAEKLLAGSGYFRTASVRFARR